MFVGHYAASFAAKAIKPDLPLWHLFIAAQLVDFAWAGLVLIGVEKVRITPGFMAASPLELYHMPWTHSLVMSLAWAAASAALYGAIVKPPRIKTAAALFGLVVVSHWLLDLLVHAPDLALWPGGPKVGFALWNSLFWSQVLEIGLLILGFLLWLRADPRGKLTPVLLLLFILALQAFNHLPNADAPSAQQFAATALLGYSLLTLAAWAAERFRS